MKRCTPLAPLLPMAVGPGRIRRVGLPRRKETAPGGAERHAGSPKAFGPTRVAAGPKGSGLLRRGPERGAECAVPYCILGRDVITPQTSPAREPSLWHVRCYSSGGMGGSHQWFTATYVKTGFCRSNGLIPPSVAIGISARPVPPVAKHFNTPNAPPLGPERAFAFGRSCILPNAPHTF